MNFTTRPLIQGTFGVVASTHWLASAVGMKLLEAGGNAFDAAAGAGFVLSVVEPHLNGPLGEVPILIWPACEESPLVICGQGPSPSKATITHYRNEGLTLVPGSGLLAAVVPGAFGAWILMLRDHGTLRLRQVMEPAIHYARHGHPLLNAASCQIALYADLFRSEWPSSACVWMPNGAVPHAGKLFRNPALAEFWDRLLDEAETASGRTGQLEAARCAFYEGPAAEAIDSYLRDACVMDGTGERRRGVLSADDLASWQATVERSISIDYSGWTVWKPGPWTQGPSLLQSLQTADARRLRDIDHLGDRFVHEVAEILKLSMADREAFYGDPEHSDIPLRALLSAGYASGRAKLISESASREFRPGSVSGFEHQASAFVKRASERRDVSAGIGGGEPTMTHLENRWTDTVHVDVVDRWGNMVSATPSGGWLQSSPVVPGIGVPLNTRAQMFWLEPDLPTSLAPGRRPRTTLSPSMAVRPDGGRLAFGTPGGDQQDQWQFIFLLRLIHCGLNLQEAIDAPLFHTAHLQSSFYPRATRPGHLLVEPGYSRKVINALRDRGHDLETSEPWSIGRLTAAESGTDGVLAAGATPRLMQAYAIGR